MALHLVVLCHHLWVLLVLHLGLLFFFFFFFFLCAGITVANGYWWIWLWIHNREKRKIEVLGFREFAYGFTISISPQPYQTPGFSKFFSKFSLYIGNLFFFFFWGLTHTHYSIFSLSHNHLHSLSLHPSHCLFFSLPNLEKLSSLPLPLPLFDFSYYLSPFLRAHYCNSIYIYIYMCVCVCVCVCGM